MRTNAVAVTLREMCNRAYFESLTKDTRAAHTKPNRAVLHVRLDTEPKSVADHLAEIG